MSSDNTIPFSFRISRGMGRSVEAHAKRLGKTKASIMREAFEFYESEQRIEAAIEKRMAKFRDQIIEENEQALGPVKQALVEIWDELTRLREQKK
ncbi:hypothetical protein [Massilia sp. NP310]|uniref:hypothetical protein n=1 Tax=Massilia sp. NP310 TaxID=2861282 RepID=UPI001C62F6F3|nr:hypothetical protein [Massilia sp. NP310]QYG02235.1 hypothetical protein KY496_01960 [Massilia sp. NP310]